jgi:integrase
VERGCLSPAWSRAVRARQVAENPWKLVTIPGRDDTAEPPFWTAEELDRLLAAAAGWVRDVILVGVNSGGRITSILSLRWRDVHFDRGVIRLDSKTGIYEVPMSGTLRDVLERRRFTSKSPYVFPDQSGEKPRRGTVAYKAIRQAVRKSGIPEKGRYNHILRHTFASHAIMRGIPLVIVSKWLGHATIHMTLRYAHLAKSESDRQMATFSLGSDLPQAVKPPPPVDDPADK